MQLLIVEFIISNQNVAYTFTIKFIKMWSFVVSLCGYAPRVHKHMSLMAKVNHLAWFKGPIFQEAYLESTLTLEIPNAYSYCSLWSQLRSRISSIFKIESRGLLIVKNDIWGKSWQSFEHNFPPGGVTECCRAFCATIYIFKMSLKAISLWCREEQIVWRFCCRWQLYRD